MVLLPPLLLAPFFPSFLSLDEVVGGGCWAARPDNRRLRVESAANAKLHEDWVFEADDDDDDDEDKAVFTGAAAVFLVAADASVDAATDDEEDDDDDAFTSFSPP